VVADPGAAPGLPGLWAPAGHWTVREVQL